MKRMAMVLLMMGCTEQNDAARECVTEVDWTCPPEVGDKVTVDYLGRPLTAPGWRCLDPTDGEFTVELWPDGSVRLFYWDANNIPPVDRACWPDGAVAREDERCYDESGRLVECTVDRAFPAGFPPGPMIGE